MKDFIIENAENLIHKFNENPLIDLEKMKRIVGSCSINFLFGSGVNGSAFPQFAGFGNTKAALVRYGQPGENIEEELRALDSAPKDEVIDVFCNEFNDRQPVWDSNSAKNLQDLLLQTSLIVSKAENRHPESKRINVFTLNYDHIVETELENLGQFSYTLTTKKSKAQLPFEIVGYNTKRREYIPTFAIYKLHGSANALGKINANEIVLPGEDKLGNVVTDFYETLFSMKGELIRKNSVLFVIGYSWNDSHVNSVISDAVDNGLTTFALQYRDGDMPSGDLVDKVIIIPPRQADAPQDTTRTLADIFKGVLEQ